MSRTLHIIRALHLRQRHAACERMLSDHVAHRVGALYLCLSCVLPPCRPTALYVVPATCVTASALLPQQQAGRAVLYTVVCITSRPAEQYMSLRMRLTQQLIAMTV